jgi:hypothetical protein
LFGVAKVTNLFGCMKISAIPTKESVDQVVLTITVTDSLARLRIINNTLRDVLANNWNRPTSEFLIGITDVIAQYEDKVNYEFKVKTE